MFVATSLVGVANYLFNLLMGRMLSPSSFGIVVSLNAIFLILTVCMGIIRLVMSQYASRFQALGQQRKIGALFLSSLRQALIYGGLATLIFALGSRQIASFLQIPSLGTVIMLPLSLLPVLGLAITTGVMQGLQRFGAWGATQILMGCSRLALGVLLVLWGLDAMGAMASVPLSNGLACLVGLLFLAPILLGEKKEYHPDRRDIYHYSFHVTLGLASFALLTNIDVLLVKHFFSPVEAGYYSVASIMGKVIYFFPAAVAMVMFPKASRRHALNQESSHLLRLSLLVAALPCGLLTVAYFLFPSPIVSTLFGSQYLAVAPVLGMLGVAMSVYALLNIWLNYHLSIRQVSFVYLLLFGVVFQGILIVLFHSSLLQVASVLALSSLALYVGSEIFLHWHPGRSRVGNSLNEIRGRR